LEFRLNDIGLPGNVSLKPFYRIHGRRYVVYWDVLNSEEAEALKREFQSSRDKEADLAARTLDHVRIGNETSEKDHNLSGEKSQSGFGAYGQFMSRRWRDANDGWFSYELKTLPDQPLELYCTYWGGELGERAFDILVDGTLVATEKLTSCKPDSFYDKTYSVPPKLTQGKNSVVVRFQAHPRNTAGGLFGLRMLKRAVVKPSTHGSTS
jgi:uncharacterized protein